MWRREWDATESTAGCKLHGVFDAFAGLGVEAEPVVWSDDEAVAVQERLRALDGALVWVNPIERGRDRTLLDEALRAAADSGVFVSAYPDVILKLGTKRVLWDTRELTWSSDVALYGTVDELLERLDLGGGPRVLKRYRGMGGDGVWKVEDAGGGDVVVQHATGDGSRERLPLAVFARRCAPYFPIIDQPYVDRLADGMIRAYLTHDRVVGFTHQFPRGLLPPGTDARNTDKIFEPPDEPRYARLRERLESEWVPQLQRVLGIETHHLPVIWDADFFLGDTEESYLLCEINCSSTFRFPESAMEGVARAALERIAAR